MKKNFTLKICLTLLFLMFLGIIMSQNTMAVTNETAKITGKYNYQYAKQVLDIVNQERAKVGKPALKMTEGLFKAAQQRAAELAVTYDPNHLRPDGSSCFTAFPNDSTEYGENIAMGQTTPAMVMNDWMNSDGHMKNILGIIGNYTTIGIGCFEKDGILHWVQCFGNAGTELKNYPANETKTVTVPVKPGSVTYKLTSVDSVTKGNEIDLTITGEHAVTGAFKNGKIEFTCDNKNFTWASKDTKIATVVNGKVKGISAGKTTITATIGNKTMNCEFTVAPKLEKIELDGPIDGELKVETGADMPLYVVYLPIGTLEKPAVTWTSSNPEIATVVDGMVKTLKPGKVTITAKTGNYIATKEITVIAKANNVAGSNTGTGSNSGTSTEESSNAGTNAQGTDKKTNNQTANTNKNNNTKSAILPMGDNTVIIYAGVMVISLAGIAYIITRKIKNNK